MKSERNTKPKEYRKKTFYGSFCAAVEGLLLASLFLTVTGTRTLPHGICAKYGLSERSPQVWESDEKNIRKGGWEGVFRSLACSDRNTVRTAAQLNKYVAAAPVKDPEDSAFITNIHLLKDDPFFAR